MTIRAKARAVLGKGLPIALKDAVAIISMPQQPQLQGTRARYSAAIPMTSGELSIKPDMASPKPKSGRATANPQIKENWQLALTPWRTRSMRLAPKFWPTKGPIDPERAKRSIAATDSIRPATPNPATGPRAIHKSESQLTDGLSAEVEQININRQLADQGLDPTYPIGSTGFNMQNYQQGYRRRDAVDDEFLKPAELNEFIRNFNPDAQIFKGEEYVLQSGGTSKKINPLLGKEGQRPLGMSKETTRTASKRGGAVERNLHKKTKESKDMDTLSSKMNGEEIKRRKANGTWDAQWDNQFITLEHDVRLNGNPCLLYTSPSPRDS